MGCPGERATRPPEWLNGRQKRRFLTFLGDFLSLGGSSKAPSTHAETEGYRLWGYVGTRRLDRHAGWLLERRHGSRDDEAGKRERLGRARDVGEPGEPGRCG